MQLPESVTSTESFSVGCDLVSCATLHVIWIRLCLVYSASVCQSSSINYCQKHVSVCTTAQESVAAC